VLQARAKVTEVDGAESDCRDGAEHLRRPGRSGVCRRLRDRPSDAARPGQDALPGSARVRAQDRLRQLFKALVMSAVREAQNRAQGRDDLSTLGCCRCSTRPATWHPC